MTSTQNLLKIIGCHHKYQIICAAIYFILQCIVEIPAFYLPFMTSSPIVKYDYVIDGKKFPTEKQMTYELCYNLTQNHTEYSIIKEKSIDNWSLQFDKLYCNRILTSILGSSLYLGSILSFIYIFFFNKICKETSIKFFCFLFGLTFLLVLIKNYWVILIFNILVGFFQLIITIKSLSILTEITCKEYRSYFISTHYLAALLGSVVISQIIAINLDWKVFYLSLAGTLVLVNIPNVFLTRSNPVFLIGVKKDFETAKINSKFILEMNKPHSEEKDLVLPEEKLSLYFKEIDDLQISTTEKNYSSNKVDEEEHQITSVQDFNSDLNEKIDSEFMIVFKMQITFIFHLLMIFLTVYEIKIFGDNKYKKQISLAMNINIGCQILGTIIFSYLMNSKYIGRKYSYIILVTSFICIRLYNLFAKDLSLIRFFILRLCINLSHSSCNTLIFESFTNKLRVKYYGQIFFVGKIFVFFVPYIYEFTTHFEYEIINIVVGILAILNMLIFIKETHGKVLVD